MYPNLKLEIFKRGIHQNALARELGLNEAILSKIIRGNREPTDSQRRMLSEYLRADQNWLFERFEPDVSPSAALPAGGSLAKNGDF